MKKIFLKYNPYKLETEIKVDGQELAENSVIREKYEGETRLQEWIELLPELLVNEFNDRNFDIIFQGIQLDYEDVLEIFIESQNNGLLEFTIEHIPAKETSDKEILIEEVFSKIQDGPFEELKSNDIINAFNNAKNEEFEVSVVATMSAGKSTLINSLLSQELMPSSQEACTAIITRIKDSNTELGKWQAQVYDKNNNLISTHENVDYPTLRALNANENVTRIEMKGNIPFVNSDEVSLVLTDTPGPNNSRNQNHKAVQSHFLNNSSKALVLYVLEGTFGSDDDNALLKRVAESMSSKGKQSKDRFIFVLNKLDNSRKTQDGPIEGILQRTKDYLGEHGINKPNLFPVAALPALEIRNVKNGVYEDEEEIEEVLDICKKFKNQKNTYYHFERHAPLPHSIKNKINVELENAIENENEYRQVEIHSGIISIEAAIKQYVEKYAKTAKIKNIVDTFQHRLEEVGCFEETKKSLSQNQEKWQESVTRINILEDKIKDIRNNQKFDSKVKEAVTDTKKQIDISIRVIVQKYQEMITQKINAIDEEIALSNVEIEVKSLQQFAKKLEPQFEFETQEILENNLINTTSELWSDYKQKLHSLTEELNLGDNLGLVIDPLKLMSGSIRKLEEDAIKKITESREELVGEEWVANTSKKWYKPWTWFQESGYYRKKYQTVEFVKGSVLAQEFFTPIQADLKHNIDLIKEYTNSQSDKIVSEFKNNISQLDTVLDKKLEELKSYASDKELAEARIQECNKKLEWLSVIQKEVDSILEI